MALTVVVDFKKSFYFERHMGKKEQNSNNNNEHVVDFDVLAADEDDDLGHIIHS